MLLVMLALRVGKSVAGFVFPGHMDLFAMIGMVGMAETGPLVFLFMVSLFNSGFTLRRWDWLHFLPGIISIYFAVIGLWIVYSVFTAHLIVYVLICFFYLRRNRERYSPDDLRWKWMHYLLAGITILWITFVCQLIFYQPLVYRLIVISAAIIFYALSWWAILRSRIFLEEKNNRREDANASYEELGKRIKELLEREEVYTDTNLTVSKLGTALKVQPYLVSRAINSYFNKSFSELLVGYRIGKAKQLLKDNAHRSLTVEAIAYESGFNTTSAFYNAFKKITKVTPTQFRENGMVETKKRAGNYSDPS